MTTAFFRISQGEFPEAMRAKGGYVPLYFVLACNEAVLLGIPGVSGLADESKIGETEP